MMTFDLPKFIERLETLFNTKKGTMMINPSYGVDWDLIKKAILTRDTLIDLENSIKESMNYFITNNMVSSIDTTLSQIDSTTIQITIISTVDATQYEIKTDPINISSGEYKYVKFFPLQ